jgi:deoxyadenosine/deoxycytidine kinase
LVQAIPRIEEPVMTRLPYPEMPNYAHDENAYYNEAAYKHLGVKFRPIDFVDGRTIFVDRDLVAQRLEQQGRLRGQASQRRMVARAA